MAQAAVSKRELKRVQGDGLDPYFCAGGSPTPSPFRLGAEGLWDEVEVSCRSDRSWSYFRCCVALGDLSKVCSLSTCGTMPCCSQHTVTSVCSQVHQSTSVSVSGCYSVGLLALPYTFSEFPLECLLIQLVVYSLTFRGPSRCPIMLRIAANSGPNASTKS